MAIRGDIVIECDTPRCHAELVIPASHANVENGKRVVSLEFLAADWAEDDGRFICPDCLGYDDRDEAYERAAARARNNDFAETGGKDWT